MAQLQLPPWLQPADPAQHMAQGLQIGVQIGSQQAAERFREMQMARDQEEFAQKQALAEQSFQLERQQRQEEAKQAAMRMQAQMQYQQAVSEGMDPLKALVQFGVAAGQNVGPVATAMRTLEAQNKQEPALSYAPFDMNGVKGIMRSDMQHFIPTPKAEAEPLAQGPVQGQPVIDPVSKQPVPNLIAVPNASGKGWDYKLTKPAAELSVTSAASLAGKLPDLEGTFPGISTNLGPQLIDYVKKSLPQRKSKEAKPTKTPLPYPKRIEDAVIDQPYIAKDGIRVWNGKHMVLLAAPIPSDESTPTQPDTSE